jgi:hypothetical protein
MWFVHKIENEVTFFYIEKKLFNIFSRKEEVKSFGIFDMVTTQKKIYIYIYTIAKKFRLLFLNFGLFI